MQESANAKLTSLQHLPEAFLDLAIPAKRSHVRSP